MNWLRLQGRKIRNRVRKWRRSAAYNTFIGVLWALVVVEVLKGLV